MISIPIAYEDHVSQANSSLKLDMFDRALTVPTGDRHCDESIDRSFHIDNTTQYLV